MPNIKILHTFLKYIRMFKREKNQNYLFMSILLLYWEQKNTKQIKYFENIYFQKIIYKWKILSFL